MYEFLTKPDWRDLEQVIVDLARDERNADMQRLFAMMRGREVFVRVSNPPMVLSSSGYLQLAASQGEPMRKSDAGSGSAAWATAATSASHASPNFIWGGMPWEKFLMMTMESPRLQGVKLQGKSVTVAFRRDRIPSLLAMSTR